MDLSAVVVLFLNFLLCFGISGDPYETLGVSRNADEYEIKRAYKRLAKKWHPDRSKSRDAEAKFMAIADAYQVLSDPTKKDNYDRYGNEEPSQQGHHHYQQYSSGGDQYFYFQSANGQRFAFRGDPFQQQDPFGRRRQQAWQTRTPLSERIWAKLKTLPRAALVLFGLEEVPSWAAISLAIATVVGCAVLFRMMDVDRSKEAADAEARVNKAPTEIWLHEMTCQTYNGLLRLQKPGCRTILLLLDTETRESLAKEFGQAVYPYRNHKTLTFGVVNLDKYLHWYIQLLRKSDACYGKPLHLELKNVIGTVLVLNNFKRCISIFHAKTTVVKPKDDDEGCYGFSSSSESEKSDVEAGVVNRKQKRKGKTPADEPKSAEIPDPAVDSPRLQGLSLWLERLFDGQIPKIQVEEWPKLTP